jgi:enoyl-CoA hydratase/carnithine racemase
VSVDFETEGPVAVVILDRPEVANAIDGPTAAAPVAAFRRFEADDSLRVAVLTGARGDRLSAYEQWSLDLPAALANEYRHGRASLATGQSADGLARYAAGAGRHGQAAGA